MRPFDMTMHCADEHVRALRAESRSHHALRSALGNWRRQAASFLVAFAARLEPELLRSERVRAA
ncbi:MAG TPA: hypothetical protein VNT60_03720 [Deinococcales bacterium]|nr:hypothetical protein [Deinococcales bacterium]